MLLSGQTPLFRAKHLEKHLGIETLYLKLEGSNPTGHKNDRIAESLVQYAVDSGFKKILVYGSDRYLRSILYFANYKEIEIFAPITKVNIHDVKKFNEVNWIKVKVGKGLTENDVFESYAQENQLFFLSEWERKPFIRGLAIQRMMEETLSKLDSPTHLWTQLNGGYTLKSLYHEVMRNWVNGLITHIPKIYCGVDPKLNKAIEENSALKGFSDDFLDHVRDAVDSTKANRVVIDDEMLRQTVKLIKKLEHITITTNEAYSLAALIQSDVRENGTHVVFLNDGKSDIKITEISKDSDLDINEILEITRKLLEPYNDSVEETIDAIKKARDVGFIFKATRKDEVHGICIVVHMGFEDFIPSYHLAYIGVKKGNTGRGLATELMSQAIEKTKGNLSLHVDIPNRRAKKLYEKMGFVHTYDRMLYKG